jgi:SnoaL-like polyketide cyclase
MFTDWAVEKKTRALSDGTWYAAEWVMTGVHTGDVPGLPATGRSFRVVGAGGVRVGLIVHATEYFNMADLRTQVGILSPPPG